MADNLENVYLIDGSSYIYRAYYAVRNLGNSKGFATNAVLGFTNMLIKVVRDENPDGVIVVFDAKGPTFRKDLYSEYKANRRSMPDDLIPQIPVIKDIVRGFRIPALELEGYEADDVIATLAERFALTGADITIVTGDKDLMQMVKPGIRLLDTMKGKISGPDEVRERFGVPPEKVIEVLGLAGDSSDNVPGVPGIGEKTASALIAEFGGIDELLANIDRVSGKKRQENLKDFAEQALLSRKLVTLIRNVPIDFDLQEARRNPPDNAALSAIFQEMEFGRLLSEFMVKEEANPDNYKAILSKSDLMDLVEKLKGAESFALDCETTSLDAVRADLVGLSFSVNAEEAFYIPLGHDYPAAPEQLDRKETLETLKPILEDPAKPKTGQNIKYDALVLRRAGINLAGIAFDTMIASYLSRPGVRSHSLDSLAADLLDYKTITYEDVAGSGKSKKSFFEIEIDKATAYAAEDADITFRLADKLRPMIKSSEQSKLFNEIEMPLLEILADMEWAGIRIDPVVLQNFSLEMEEKLSGLEALIHEQAGIGFNIASPKQLGEVLFEKLKLPKGKRTQTGWSTNVEILNKLAENHKIASDVLEYRSLAKLKGTYADALPKLINPETGRIHTSFNQAATATGRLSSSDPNLQNIPIRTKEGQRIREAFIPAKGCVFISADYSQVELRVLAHVAGEKSLQKCFEQGEDIHARTAGEIFGVFPQMVSPEQRRKAKAVNFGIIYGISAFGLAKALGVGRKEAQAYIDGYFARHPGVKTYMEKAMDEAREKLYVETIMGRRCAVPEINSKNINIRGYAERNAINYPIQGSAADIIKAATIRTYNRIKNEKLKTRILLQVHDELLLEAPREEADAAAALVKEEMKNAFRLDAPLAVDVGMGENWREAH